jgi:hypothetical protein
MPYAVSVLEALPKITVIDIGKQIPSEGILGKGMLRQKVSEHGRSPPLFLNFLIKISVIFMEHRTTRNLLVSHEHGAFGTGKTALFRLKSSR